MISRTKMTLLAGVVVLTIAGAGAGIAFAQGSDPPSPTPPNATPAPHHPCQGHDGRGGPGGRGGPLARIEHGEATVDTDHGYQVVDIQRGVVDSVNSGQLTVRSADGFTATYVVDSSTKIRKGRQASDASQLAAQDRVTVVATKTGNTATATRIADTGPPR